MKRTFAETCLVLLKGFVAILIIALAVVATRWLIEHVGWHTAWIYTLIITTAISHVAIGKGCLLGESGGEWCGGCLYVSMMESEWNPINFMHWLAEEDWDVPKEENMSLDEMVSLAIAFVAYQIISAITLVVLLPVGIILFPIDIWMENEMNRLG